MEPEDTHDYPTRAEYREAERAKIVYDVNSLYPSEYAENELGDFTTRAGFIARSRKAFIGAVGAFASAFGPALIIAGADGAISWGEVLPSLIIGATLAGGTFIVTWRVPNAEG